MERGIVRGFPRFEVSIEGTSHRHRWQPGEKYLARYEHPLWQWLQDNTPRRETVGEFGPITHGAVWDYDWEWEVCNGDFLEDWRLVQAIRWGTAPDIDVYDAATWSVVAPLSGQSVAQRGRAVDFPDLTGGTWETRQPLVLTPPAGSGT